MFGDETGRVLRSAERANSEDGLFDVSSERGVFGMGDETSESGGSVRGDEPLGEAKGEEEEERDEKDYWWLSFADELHGFLGVVIMPAVNHESAYFLCTLKEINPGGEVQVVGPLKVQVVGPLKKYMLPDNAQIGVLLNLEQVEAINRRGMEMRGA